jgi:hypothetical protein
MKRLLSSLPALLAVALLALAVPPQTTASTQTLVDCVDPADLAAVNGEGVYAPALTDTDGIGLDRTVKMANLAQTLGPLSARTRAKTPAGNGIKEEEVQYAVERSQSSLTYIEPEYYVAERSPDYHQRALARCPRSHASLI